MPQLQNTAYKVPVGSAWTFAALEISEKTLAYLVKDDVYEISEVITDTVTGDQYTRTLDKEDVVFDQIQTTTLLGSYEHNIRVSVPSTKITQKRRYTYQLVITHDNGSGEADTDYIQKTDEIDIQGD